MGIARGHNAFLVLNFDMWVLVACCSAWFVVTTSITNDAIKTSDVIVAVG